MRGAAVTGAPDKMMGDMMARFPKLEFVSSFGVGYDNIDVKYAVEHGITVTNTPEVLNEEVADTALGLLLCTVREFPQASNFLRAGKWMERQYPLSKATLRDRTVGMVGMGRIGRAIARRLDGFGVPVVYHSRNPQAGVTYKHYPKLIDMARDVDTLILITPGGPSTRHLVNAEVLDALGPARHRHQHVARHGGRRCRPDQGAEGARKSTRPASTCSSTSPRCRRSISRWTMSCCSRISARPRSTPARRWNSSWSTTCWPGRRASRR